MPPLSFRGDHGGKYFILVDVGQQCGLSEADPVSCHIRVYIMFRVYRSV